MPPILKNVLALALGIVVGSVVNMSIINISGSIIPPPPGVSPEDIESLKANIHLFKPEHFLMPFLAHALGTFSGSLIAAYIAATRKLVHALIIGCFFLAGGAAMVSMVPSPMWFNILDLGLAYIPMGFLGFKLVERLQSNS